MKENETVKQFRNRENKHLEKAHAIPKSLGGTYDPNNIVFLCGGCHAESPDTYDRKVFFGWITEKRSRCIEGWDFEHIMTDITMSLKAHNHAYAFSNPCLLFKRILVLRDDNRDVQFG